MIKGYVRLDRPWAFLGYLLSLLNDPLEYEGLVRHTVNTNNNKKKKRNKKNNYFGTFQCGVEIDYNYCVFSVTFAIFFV
jgi:hypothetical protein